MATDSIPIVSADKRPETVINSIGIGTILVDLRIVVDIKNGRGAIERRRSIKCGKRMEANLYTLCYLNVFIGMATSRVEKYEFAVDSNEIIISHFPMCR